MTNEDKQSAIQMGVTLSTSLMSASLAIVAVEVAFATFVIQRNGATLELYGLLLLSVSCLVCSIYAGGKGIDRARKSGFYGNWTLSAGRRNFGAQGLFLVLALVTFGLMSFFPWGPPVDPGVSVLRELKVHTAILDSILHRPGQVVRVPPILPGVLSYRVPILLLLLSGGVALVGLVLSITGSLDAKAVGRILLSLGGLSLFSGLTLDLGGCEVMYEPSRPVVNRRVSQHIEHMAVYPFETGKSRLIESAQLDSVLLRLKQISSDDVLQIVLVGRADMRRLRPSIAIEYGSNPNLAMKRAVFVRSAILADSSCLPLGNRILTVTGGAEYTGWSTPQDQLAKDRCVDVYVYTKDEM